MNEKATTMLAANMEGIDFYPNSDWLGHDVAGPEALAKMKTEGKAVFGAWSFNRDTGSGTLRLDGGPSNIGGIDGIKHVYAHEIAHAVDWIPNGSGGGRQISGTAKWMDAFSTEILGTPGKEPLSKYDSTSASEGFAEFGRLAFTAPHLAREQFPKSWAVWKDHGLVD